MDEETRVNLNRLHEAIEKVWKGADGAASEAESKDAACASELRTAAERIAEAKGIVWDVLWPDPD